MLVHEPWRWLGLVLGRNISIDSELFIWVRAVATTLVAGLVMRLVFFPAGGIGAIPLGIRLLAVAIGLGVFFLLGKRLALGILAGSLTLLAGALAWDAHF